MATSTTPQPDAADPPENPPRAWTLTKGGAFQWVQGPPGDSLQPEAIGAVMEVTKWLKPSISGSRIGDRASVQAATRVNAEQASHDEGLVKGSHHGNIETSPVASVSKVQAHLRDAARFR